MNRADPPGDGGFRASEPGSASSSPQAPIAPEEVPAGGIRLPHRLPTVRRVVASLQQVYLALYAAEVGIWEWSVEQNTVTWSMFVDKIFGLPPEDATCSCEELFRRIPAEDLAQARAIIDQALRGGATGQRFEFQCRVHRPDGEWRWIEVAGSVGGSPDLCLLGTVQDVTERRRSEEEARFYRALLEHQNEAGLDGILVVSVDEHILYFNRRFVEIWAIPAAVLESGELQAVADWLKQAVAEPDTAVFRIEDLRGQPDPAKHDELRLRDGRVIERFRAPVVSREGDWLGRVWHFRDITGQRGMEGRTLHTQRLESLGSVATGIAHELKNILTPIVVHTQVLQEDLEPNHPAQEGLAEVMKGCNRARELVHQILTFSRRDETRRDPVDLRRVVADAVELLKATIPTSVTVQTRLTAALPPMPAHPTQIHQVVMNLGINAWQALESDTGLIEIALDDIRVGGDATQIALDLAPGRYALLSVRDNGRGMNETTLNRIFEPFFTTKADGCGTGLGLPVVAGIVRSHGGTITVDSKPGQGALFRIYLPVPEAPSA